ncbi:DnaJ domain-containing protein [Phenylobacterium sp.]|uniref:DnaJ domain-containing protein n=1 Tax=Phenylobacterium sp. TaxID=1871053 RepID=UPI002737EAA5|nr:DnaJ domain-containing protein [Phenylobacterium sp.]MDP3870411.1 DnaJ domain-containing protein [Phenylobacterium sp.]
MREDRDYYRLLGVSAQSEEVVIKAAYRALAQRYHPDTTTEPTIKADKKWLDINEAYEVLGDRRKRAEYDRLRRDRRNRRRLVSTASAAEPADGDKAAETLPADTADTPPPSDGLADGEGLSSNSQPSEVMRGRRQGAILAISLTLLAVAMVALLLTLDGRRGLDSGTGLQAPQRSTGGLALASPPAGALVRPAGQMIEWDEQETPGTTVFAIDGVVITLSGRTQGTDRLTVLNIRGPEGPAIELTELAAFDHAAAEFAVGDVDMGTPTPEVIVTTFSGGAHCCVTIRVLDYIDGAWKTIQVAVQDGSEIGTFPTDRDGNGRPEFELLDGSFLYAFTAYAMSWAPPLYSELHNGELQDVSGGKGFRKQYERYMSQAQAECAKRENGACAAFVAAASRVGKSDWAWPIMLASYDPQSDWSNPTGCRLPIGQGTCPTGSEVTFPTYPEALRAFLGAQGYMSPMYVAPANAAGPSFDCSRVSSANLKLICGTPELSAADRELARIYTRAMAFSTAPAVLRAAQIRFIEQRNNAPPDPDSIYGMYLERIRQLKALAGETP